MKQEDPSQKRSDGEKPKKLSLRLPKQPNGDSGSGVPPQPKPAEEEDRPRSDPDAAVSSPPETVEPPVFIEENPARPADDDARHASKPHAPETAPAPPRLKLRQPAETDPPGGGASQSAPERKAWEPMEETFPAPLEAGRAVDPSLKGGAEKKPPVAERKEDGPPKPPPLDAPVIRPEAETADSAENARQSADAAPKEETDFPTDAVSNAIKAGKSPAPRKRVVKLLTIAAGLAISALAVWWSLESLPYVVEKRNPPPAAPTSAQPVEEVPESSVSAPPQTEAKREAAPPAAPPEPRVEQDPAISAYVDSLRIEHVELSESGSPRVLIAGVAFAKGDSIHPEHGLRLERIDVDARTVTLADGAGALYSIAY